MNQPGKDFKVDFFIVGAPKSGTTSLAYYLSSHPDICMSCIKEPFYFNKKSPLFRGVKSFSEYQSLFNRCSNDGRIKGEGTTWYLYSIDAVDNILKHNEDAKFIVCLRNPIEAVVSWHNHMLLVGAENIINFESAWDIQEERKLQGFKPRVYSDISVLQYHDLFLLGKQLYKLKQKVHEKNLHIIYFDDFKNDVASSYYNTLSFLNLRNDERKEFPILYERSATRHSLLQNIGACLSYRQRVKLAMILLKCKINIYELYLHVNTKITKKNKLSLKQKRKLALAFRDDIDLLSNTCGRDLSSWYNKIITEGYDSTN